jgi:hypothetical protein
MPSGIDPSGSPTSRLAVRPATNAHVIPGRKPARYVTSMTATSTRLGFTPPMTMTGASAAWTMPRMTARSGLTYEMIAPPEDCRIRFSAQASIGSMAASTTGTIG